MHFEIVFSTSVTSTEIIKTDTSFSIVFSFVKDILRHNSPFACNFSI